MGTGSPQAQGQPSAAYQIWTAWVTWERSYPSKPSNQPTNEQHKQHQAAQGEQAVKAGWPVKEQELPLWGCSFPVVQFSTEASEIWSDAFDVIIQVPWFVLTCAFAEEGTGGTGCLRLESRPLPTLLLPFRPLPCSEKPGIQIFDSDSKFSLLYLSTRLELSKPFALLFDSQTTPTRWVLLFFTH